MKYKQITIITSAEFSDIVSLSLIDAGSEGVSVFDSNELLNCLKETNWDYLDENFLKDAPQSVMVSGYFSLDFDESVIEKEAEYLKKTAEIETGPLEISVSIINSSDWENVWKKYYKPIKINKIAIVPKWLKNPYKTAVGVFINPGMAFGTGNHETTSMCISLMQKTELNEKCVADVGCGSGILGICALKLGAKSCTFIDTDPNAVKAAKENCEYNALNENCEIIEASLFENNGKTYDVIFANLTADILKILYPSLDAHLKTGGKIVISGIIAQRATEIEETFYKNFKLIEKSEKNDWRAYLLEKTKAE